MSNYPMVNEINRLVGDLLAGGGEVFLPGVGSLYGTPRRAAHFAAERGAAEPGRVVYLAGAGRVAGR